jgi:hypothetical protein
MAFLLSKLMWKVVLPFDNRTTIVPMVTAETTNGDGSLVYATCDTCENSLFALNTTDGQVSPHRYMALLASR